MSRLPPKQVSTVNLKGGLDLASTLLNVSPGAALNLVNFEPELEGGYRRVNGYERVDGRPAPSAAVYYTVGVTDASAIAVGATLTGVTSGATSKVVIKDENTLGITALTGGYELGETANGTTITQVELLGGQDDIDDDALWQYEAEEYYRALIGAVPGTGNALYAFQFGANKYAFRVNSGSVKLYKSSTSGWVEVAFFKILFFDGGVLAEGDIAEGATITGATSAATGTVKRFIKNNGVYGADASGYMIVDTANTFTDNENIQVGGITKCVADGASAAITITSGTNKFQHVEHNFYGSTATRRVYGCDGVNPAWEFDGTIFCPIYFPDKAAAYNKPTFIDAHRTFLFLQFETGQMAASSPGEPLIFNGLLGATDYGLGDTPTGIMSRSGDVLAIYTRNRTFGLYGTSPDDFVLRLISESFGAIPYTVQKIGTVYALDGKGIAPLERVEAYGDFESATVSRLVRPILEIYKNRVIGSCAVKARNQYRLFFDDGVVLVMGDDQYLGESIPAFSTLQLSHIPTFVSASEDENGNEVILFGDEDGFIYQMEKGYNFDGGAIEFFWRQPFAHQDSPHARKSYRRLFLDMDAERSVTLQVSTEIGFGKPEVATTLPRGIVTAPLGGYWAVDNWDEFYWYAATSSSEGVSLAGTGNNISVLVYGNSHLIRPFTIQTVEIHYIPRRLRRE
ncbi:MAG: hypothetical protein Q8L60_10630 [Gammaproteobacteria bacterium]|nr:hypothetical protein [Gammaproteobacteria bacterium]MDP2346803.1 hypothetical protein [Gammaproteobacteria bacterium]